VAIEIKVDAPFAHGAQDGTFEPGSGKIEWFRDHEHGPEMVVVPAGSFVLGSPDTELRYPSEGPQTSITIAQPFAVGRLAVTRGQFAAFVADTSFPMEGGAQYWTGTEWIIDPNGSWSSTPQDDSHPVVCVSWHDANAYALWLSQKTGKTYRLPSEAEREYVARAGTTTPFWCGVAISSQQANFDGRHTLFNKEDPTGIFRRMTVPADAFEPNPWGLHNVHGNVWEWCQDLWQDTLKDIPTDGSPQTEGRFARVLRGGSWTNGAMELRSARRWTANPNDRNSMIGLRLARAL
jgi:formylglycine-generating enzyme required for sulfatase activity